MHLVSFTRRSFHSRLPPARQAKILALFLYHFRAFAALLFFTKLRWKVNTKARGTRARMRSRGHREVNITASIEISSSKQSIDRIANDIFHSIVTKFKSCFFQFCSFFNLLFVFIFSFLEFFFFVLINHCGYNI